MTEHDQQNKKVEDSEKIQVIPSESPLENYFVAEHLQRMPNLFARGLIYLVILVILSAFVYSLVAKIDMVAECQAVTRPQSHKIRILSDRSGYIEKIFISEGDVVTKNTPIFLIRSREAITHLSKVEELHRSIPLQEEYFDTKISAARDKLNQMERDFDNSQRVKHIKLEQNKLSLHSIASDLNYWQKEIKPLSEEFQNAKALFEKGIISIREYNNTRSRLEKARAEVEKSMSQRDITLKENHIIEQELIKERASYLNNKIVLEKEIKNLTLEKRTALNAMQNELNLNEKMLSLQNAASASKQDEKAKEKVVRAEMAGTISELLFRNVGEYVRESDLLCTILPSDSPLYMDITVANKDIGFIKKGLGIRYKFDAFPFSDYGTVSGRVSAISPSAVEDGALGFIYHVQGSLDQTTFEIKQERYPIRPGMTATAELVTERISVFALIFRKFRGL
jgi:multidrug efflux pump subunit AcrA (membrane-fusion protein)